MRGQKPKTEYADPDRIICLLLGRPYNVFQAPPFQADGHIIPYSSPSRYVYCILVWPMPINLVVRHTWPYGPDNSYGSALQTLSCIPGNIYAASWLSWPCVSVGYCGSARQTRPCVLGNICDDTLLAWPCDLHGTCAVSGRSWPCDLHGTCAVSGRSWFYDLQCVCFPSLLARSCDLHGTCGSAR